MKIATFLSCVPVLAALAACPPPDPPPPDDTITAACTEPADVPCIDKAEQALEMTPNETTPGLISSDDKGGGVFHSNVDSTAGGFPATQGYVYAKFTDTGLEKVELTDDASFSSMDWDISFRRFIIRLNSGTGGPSCVTAARTGTGTTFDDLAEVPGNLDFHAEAFMSPDTCDVIQDGSGLPGAPGVVLQNYWTYPGCVSMTGNVYVVELATGHHVKLVVKDYYTDAQQAQCDSVGTVDEPSGSGNFQIDWAFLD